MLSDHYIWFIWASAFLVPWLLVLLLFPVHRRVMLWASALTIPFGLTEPIFVPRYWNPPSLFDLAQKTGFDLESLIFCFGIGGIAVVLYNVLTRQEWAPVPVRERSHRRHHRAAVLVPIVAFPLLSTLPWNPIYPAIAALALGAVATSACRPDLGAKTLIGGALFSGYYMIFMLGLVSLVPGYIERVWDLSALSGVLVDGIPLEELLFGLAFGAYWTSVYEHLTWRRLGPSN